MSVADVFCRIYVENYWRSPETRSGVGSEFWRTVRVRKALPPLLAELKAHSLLDAGCGDFNWMQHVPLDGIRYHGCDVVPELIEENRAKYGGPDRAFSVVDLTIPQWLPFFDVILCRTVLFHLSFENIRAVLANFVASRSTWLLATHYPDHARNADCTDGDWRRLNLEAAPFFLPPPCGQICEDEPSDSKLALGYLALWRLDEVADALA